MKHVKAMAMQNGALSSMADTAGATIANGATDPDGAGKIELPAVWLILLGSTIANGAKAPNGAG